MSITPKDLLHNKKDLNKNIAVENIDLSEVSIDDLVYNKKNYENYINLKSLLDCVSTCQISDAYNGISRRSGVIKELKPINKLRVWGRITTCVTNSDDWGTSALAIDESNYGDVLFIKTNNSDMSVWGELASTCAKKNGIKSTVIYGSVRDLDALYYMDYPIFACDYAPNAGSALGLGEINVDVDINGMTVCPGDFFYGDETGVVVIPQKLFKKVMIQTLAVKLKESNIIEDINQGKTLSQVVGLK
ncbi:RraA family protein [uncultured Methanobrevibacter sp.]|uniref:RraA family protein n=1 Tax=uncultured Methanobrevibacter sp. TaxID=253161 RepID=UPI002609A2CF|nr:RraA family protein [uncultured Methanobrevibacter sp.]